jgi:NADPH:quinone reductase-like Zn-dependent oxidoreductase
MKAALLNKIGGIPTCEECMDPAENNAGECILHVKASAVKQLDKAKAAGKHYTSYEMLPAIVGTDGVGILNDGTAIYTMQPGLLAEKALVKRQECIPIPANVNFAVAAALPNALIGSDAALLLRAKIQQGAVVLVNGATGVSGKVAVQAAKLRGASKVIVTGRNAETLDALKALGADEAISLLQPKDDFIAQVRAINMETPIDIVLDYLWGQPMEMIFTAIRTSKPYPVKVILIGEMAGPNITLSSGLFRSTKIELLGSGIGSIAMPDLFAYMKQNLPEMLNHVIAGKLKIDVEEFAINEVEKAWLIQEAGKRVVITF